MKVRAATREDAAEVAELYGSLEEALLNELRTGGGYVGSLGVDASNPTGATHLYESVGMHVEQEEIVWEKLLV